MRYHWIQDRIARKEFRIAWKPGPQNIADFTSKAHPIHHFLTMRNLMYNCRNPQAQYKQCSREGVLIPLSAIKERLTTQSRTTTNHSQETGQEQL